MTLISDLFMVAGALAAGFYCFILSRRLTAFKDAESGIGHAVASLSAQVDELNRSVDAARLEANASSIVLTDQTKRAENVAQRLELLVASMHDIPEVQFAQAKKSSDENPVFSTRMNERRRQSNDAA
jgi:outer membrane murein-binding lipoprotein Lpp